MHRLCAQEAGAWQRLLDLYRPTVEAWCRRAGLSVEDAADVGQEVFAAVVRTIADFRRDRPGDSFRGWLWTVTRSRLLDFWRRRKKRVEAVGGSEGHERLLQVPADDAAEPEPAAAEVQELYRRAVCLIQREFEDRTWQAFWRVTVDGQPAAEVARALGMTPGAVYIAKSRVLKRLRQEFAELF